MAMNELLPGTEVHARGLRWEIVFSQQLGPQTRFRLRGLERGMPMGRWPATGSMCGLSHDRSRMIQRSEKQT
jgi:hypothetical protein